MTERTFLSWALCWLLLGCGGQAERSIDDGAGSASGDGASSKGETDPSGGGTPLGMCVLGFQRFENLDKKCNWLADERCYETKEAACACVCPRTDGTLCLSGFYDGDGSATQVSCD